MRIPALVCLIFLSFVQFSFSQESKFELVGKSISQGEIAILRRVDKGGGVFHAHFLGRSYKSFEFGKHQVVILGAHYQLKPGSQLVIVTADSEKGKATYFRINIREAYPVLRYEVPKRPEADQKRINEEHLDKIKALKKMNLVLDSMDYFSSPIYPIIINASFGDIRPSRCRNPKYRKTASCRYHLGTDYRSAFDIFHQRPVAAHAINSGRVVRTAENLIDGKMIILDHGNGISSEYLHLSKFLVKEGDMVKRGQKIGVTGKTGATDAIHLHLTIKMDYGKTIVDPEFFLKTLSK